MDAHLIAACPEKDLSAFSSPRPHQHWLGPILRKPSWFTPGCQADGVDHVPTSATRSDLPQRGKIFMRLWFVSVALLLCSCASLPGSPAALIGSGIPYGHNEQAASRHPVNDTVLYVETYGQGTPLLLIHGNGGSIEDMRHQIAHFSKSHMVIAADSRGHGHTPSGHGSLTYELIASDFSELLAQLDIGPVNILGWSDGGIIGLLLASAQPERVHKLAIMGANLNPAGAQAWALPLVGRWRAEVEARMVAGDASKDWPGILERLNLLEFHPDIDPDSLHSIAAPTLVMAGDRDVIRNAHTLEIFENIPKAHLCIFPGATHMIPVRQPELFNATVERFFISDFARPTTREILDGNG